MNGSPGVGSTNGMGSLRPQMPHWNRNRAEQDIMRNNPRALLEKEQAFSAIKERNSRFNERASWGQRLFSGFGELVVPMVLVVYCTVLAYGYDPTFRKSVNAQTKEVVGKAVEVAKGYRIKDFIVELNPLKRTVYLEIDPMSGFVNPPVKATGEEIKQKHKDVDVLYFFPIRGEPVKHPGISKLIVVQKDIIGDRGQAGRNILGLLEQTGYGARQGRLSLLPDGQEYTVGDTTVFSFGEPTAGYVDALLRSQRVVILDSLWK